MGLLWGRGQCTVVYKTRLNSNFIAMLCMNRAVFLGNSEDTYTFTDTFEIKIYTFMSAFKELSVDDNLEVKNVALTREAKAQVSD